MIRIRKLAIGSLMVSAAALMASAAFVTPAGAAPPYPGPTSTTSPIANSTAFQDLGPYFSFIDTRFTEACNYLPGTTVSVVLDGIPQAPLTADAQGCVSIALSYAALNQFSLNGGPLKTSTLGRKSMILTGTAVNHGILTTTIAYGLQRSTETANFVNATKSNPFSNWKTFLILGGSLGLLGAGLGALAAGRRRHKEEEELLEHEGEKAVHFAEHEAEKAIEFVEEHLHL